MDGWVDPTRSGLASGDPNLSYGCLIHMKLQTMQDKGVNVASGKVGPVWQKPCGGECGN